MSNDLTGEYPLPKTGEAKLQADVTVAAKKKLIDYIPEAFRGVVAKALENVLAAGIIALIGLLASQGIRVEIQKNTEAIAEQNELKKLELEAWGIRRVRQDN